MLKETVILSGETLFDVAVRNYGHLQGIAQISKDNGIGLTSEALPGSELKIDDSINYDLPVVFIAKQILVAPNELIVEPWQNIFDIAVQAYGHLEGIVNISKDNGIGLTAAINSGEKLKTRNEVVNKLVVDFFKGKGITIATGLSPEESEVLKPEGIGYWAIGVDFVVS